MTNTPSLTKRLAGCPPLCHPANILLAVTGSTKAKRPFQTSPGAMKMSICSTKTTVYAPQPQRPELNVPPPAVPPPPHRRDTQTHHHPNPSKHTHDINRHGKSGISLRSLPHMLRCEPRSTPRQSRPIALSPKRLTPYCAVLTRATRRGRRAW